MTTHNGSHLAKRHDYSVPRDGPKKWHRVQTVRQQEGVSLRNAARQMGLSIGKLKLLENEIYDMRLSTLYAWQRALGVPISELLLDAEGVMSEPIRQRGCLLRIAKTARTLHERSRDTATRYLAETLLNQLEELMPEAPEATAWPEVGQRRSPQDVPRLLERVVRPPIAAPCDDHLDPGYDAVI